MRLAWDGCWSTGMRMYLFPFSLLIYKQKEVCMWKRIKQRCSWEELLITELLLARHTLLCFHIGYFCFMFVKKDIYEYLSRWGWGGGKQIYCGWIVGYWWKKCVWLSPPPHIQYTLICCFSNLSPLQEVLWIVLEKPLTPLLEISFVNKHLWVWRTNANVFLLWRIQLRIQNNEIGHSKAGTQIELQMS